MPFRRGGAARGEDVGGDRSTRAGYTVAVAASRDIGLRKGDGGEETRAALDEKRHAGVHEYRWQVRVVLVDQPTSCTRLIYYPSSSAVRYRIR